MYPILALKCTARTPVNMRKIMAKSAYDITKGICGGGVQFASMTKILISLY